jgi:hypothetical protein
MKQPFGAKRARSCLPSMLWIAANHKREGAVFTSAAGNPDLQTDPTTIDQAHYTSLEKG